MKLKSLAEMVEEKATAIKDCKATAAALVNLGEEVRRSIDRLESCVLNLSTKGVTLSQDEYDAIMQRIEDVRRLRNSMEVFELQCRINKVMDKFWEELP